MIGHMDDQEHVVSRLISIFLRNFVHDYREEWLTRNEEGEVEVHQTLDKELVAGLCHFY